MKPTGAIRATAILLLCLCINPLLATNTEAPLVTTGGLHKVPDSRFALVYADPEADLSGYNRLLLMDAQVAFRKNWRQDINTNTSFNVTPEDMERIKQDLSAEFGGIFTAELQSAGFVLTDEQAEDVLIVRPAILDLNVTSPDTHGGRTRNIIRSAGDMILYLELRDSLTGDTLAKALDFQFDRRNVTALMQDRTRNEMAARRILTDWAQTLVKGLQEAMAVTPGQQAAE